MHIVRGRAPLEILPHGMNVLGWVSNKGDGMKPIIAFLTILALVAFQNSSLAQSMRIPKEPKHDEVVSRQIKQIRAILGNKFSRSEVRPDYPIQNYYAPPSPSTKHMFKVADNDSTPPPEPVNLQVTNESIHSVFVEWDASTDPESGIDYYAYAVGTAPGEGDIQWWQSVGQKTKSYSLSLAELGIPEGSPFYFSVYVVNGAGLASNDVSTGPIILEWGDLGNLNNELIIAYSNFGYDSTGGNIISGWDSTEIRLFDHFISRMNPIIKEIYGPPSHSYTVTLVKNHYYSSSNVFFPSSNEIHMSDFYPQLLTHELIHAYRDNVILSTDDLWRFHPKLSGFEESFAQGVSYVCMNRYIEFYPTDSVVDSTYLFGSSKDWDYDFRNVPEITTEDFWSDYGGIGLFWERYELGAAAMRKFHLEDNNFFRNFNLEYYARLNDDHTLTTSRDLLSDIISSIVSEVEMQPSKQWIDNQRIFDCQVKPGRKIWIKTQRYPSHDYYIFQRLYYYETFENGSDWAYWNGESDQWVYHNLNGAAGAGTVYINSDSVIWSGDLLSEPVENPPDYNGFGSDEMNFSTAYDLEPWPGGNPADYILGMNELSLYRFDVSFDTSQCQAFRVIGEELRSTTGIFGGIRNGLDGVIYIDHEGFAAEPPLPVVQGVFWGAREWASVPNPRTRGTDSTPGRVFVRFVQSDGKQYLAQRNVDWGSWNGNQAFLFDTQKMVLDSSTISSVSEANMANQFIVHQNYPNPFNPTTEIQVEIPMAGRVEISIYDILGRSIRVLKSDKLASGIHSFHWDGANNAGKRVASGFYLYKVKLGQYHAIRKMLLLK
ncbi:MAG: FlgD immunoglobulin-like domain containing protein [bacterium]